MIARPKPQQLSLDLEEAVISMRHMVDAFGATVDDLAKRLGPQQPEISARIVLQHCEKALRIANSAPMAPHARAIVRNTYNMVKRELGS